MFGGLKKRLYFSKMQLLFSRGISEGKIVPFDNEFYEKMSHTYFNCIPIYMHIKYLKPILPPGKCYDRSLLMFFCFDDALLVRADNKDLELRFGKENAGHGWIEIGNYVYDPSLMMRFERDLYYKIYSPTDVHKATKEDYKKVNGSYYDDVRHTSIDDFKIGGSKRTDLCVSIPLVQDLAKCSSDENFQRELNEYLNLIQYEEKQVHDELISRFNLVLKENNTINRAN